MLTKKRTTIGRDLPEKALLRPKHEPGDLPQNENQVLGKMCIRDSKGAILMVGGAPSFPNQFLGGELVLKNLLNDLSTECLGEVCLPNSDKDSLETRPDICLLYTSIPVKIIQRYSFMGAITSAGICSNHKIGSISKKTRRFKRTATEAISTKE